MCIHVASIFRWAEKSLHSLMMVTLRHMRSHQLLEYHVSIARFIVLPQQPIISRNVGVESSSKQSMVSDNTNENSLSTNFMKAYFSVVYVQNEIAISSRQFHQITELHGVKAGGTLLLVLTDSVSRQSCR
jgi:hypothetical protein